MKACGSWVLMKFFAKMYHEVISNDPEHAVIYHWGFAHYYFTPSKYNFHFIIPGTLKCYCITKDYLSLHKITLSC